MADCVSPHDPLCPSMDERYLPVRPECQCPLIERVKERESERYDLDRKVAITMDALANERRTANELMLERDAALAEAADLIRWKEEATAVIESWERIWTLLGEPGVIGESKAEATWVAVRNLLDWIACGGPVEAKRARHEADRDRDFAIAMANALVVERDAARARVTDVGTRANVIIRAKDERIVDLLEELAEAESVAARLVEVICAQDREWAGTEWRAMRRERDAARAEVAALSGALDVAIRLLSDVGITCTVESLIEEAEHD